LTARQLGGWFLVPAAAWTVAAWAAATVPQMYVSYALPGDAQRTPGVIVIDAPLKLTRDPATGLAHLSIDPAALGLTVRVPSSDGSPPVVIGRTGVLDIIAGANVTTALTALGSSIALQFSAPGWCNFDPAGPPPQTPTSCVAPFLAVHNEVPVASGFVPTTTTWTLAHAPVAGASCYKNGQHQEPGLDYTLAGNVITSESWRAGDVNNVVTLLCDYEWSAPR
jgi:hypothetical protein